MRIPFSKTLEKLRAGAKDISNELDRVRLDRLNLIAEIERVSRLPISDAETDERINACLDGAEREARGYYRPEAFATPENQGLSTKVDLSFVFERYPLGTLVALGFRDTIKAAMMADAKRGIDREQIGDTERAEALAKLASEREALEIAEEQLVRMCEESGLSVHRREDANPAIFLMETVE